MTMGKTHLYRISLAIVSLFFAVSAGAQGRPVWILGHGANWSFSVEAALDAGANGVEVDVRTQSHPVFGYGNENRQGQHWSLGHDFYYPESSCDDPNSKFTGVSLKWLLTNQSFLDDERFCVLWLDIKKPDQKYIKQLVEYVHEHTPDGTPYSIIYGVYEMDLDDETLIWLGKNLRQNECMNWADQPLSNLLPYIQGKIPANKHLYTRGYFRTSEMYKSYPAACDLRAAQKLPDFCCRTGVWTANSSYEAHFWLYNGSSSYPCEFDLVLTYFAHGYLPPVYGKLGLPDVITDYFNSNGVSKDGRMHIAKRNESFIGKYEWGKKEDKDKKEQK